MHSVAPETQINVYPTAATDFRAAVNSNRHANAVVSWFRNFTPTLINEARYMYGNRLFKNIPNSFGSKVNGSLNVAGVDPTLFPTITVTGVSQLGAGSHGRLQTPILTQQFTDLLTWVKGKHSLKTGFDYRYTLNKDDNFSTAGGRFDFNDRATNSGLASFLLGWTSGGSLVRPDLIESRMDYYGAFVQDDWKISQKLTLNLGLR